ncbi:protein of unknown function [Serratia sp. Tan611]|nr:protein of unknown function [Serratia sp. Tan611]
MSLLMMDVVTSYLIAIGSIAECSEYTPVSGPNGPLTRRYATAAASPCCDHSDGAHRYIRRV